MAAEPTPAAADGRGARLLKIARRAVRGAVDNEPPTPAAQGGWLAEPGATFVTLKLGEALRGCIGSVHAERPLAEDVLRNAYAAAVDDHRFPPLGRDELDRVTIEVSLLSALAPLEVAGEAELLRRLRPGVDGLYLQAGFHRALFLPQVWEGLPDPAAFVRRLKLKAGLAADTWPPETRCWTFTVRSWSEGPRDATR